MQMVHFIKLQHQGIYVILVDKHTTWGEDVLYIHCTTNSTLQGAASQCLL